MQMEENKWIKSQKNGKNTFFLKYGYVGKKITFDSNFDSGNLYQVEQLSDTKVVL